MKKPTYTVVAVYPEICCFRCGHLAEAREHKEIGEKQLKQPFYYKRWFNCRNYSCHTKQFMFDEDKVFNKNSGARKFQDAQDSQELEERFRTLF